MKKLEIQFSLARTGLMVGLQALGAKPGHIILVPDFCCDVIYHPIIELGLKVVNYEVKEDLVPDWDQLNSIDVNGVFGIVMIHYFGEPQDIDRFRSFCQAKEICLIEDNAHGYGGTFHGKSLGKFGDIGISSPRKILRTPLGGVLYVCKQDYGLSLEKSVKQLSFLSNIINFIKFIIYRLKPIHKYINFWKLRKYNFSDPYAFKEWEKSHTRMSFYELAFIQSVKLPSVARRRRQLWAFWSDYLIEQGLRPIFTDVSDESCPWAIAFYAADIGQRNSWIEWGITNKLPVFCWPSLSDEQILMKGIAFKKWERLVCIALEDFPPKLKKMK